MVMASLNLRVVVKYGSSTRISLNTFLFQYTISWDILEHRVYMFGTVLQQVISLQHSRNLQINEIRKLHRRKTFQILLDQNSAIAFILQHAEPMKYCL